MPTQQQQMLNEQTAGMGDAANSTLAPSSGGGGVPAGTYTAIGSMFGPWGTAAGAVADMFMGSGSGSGGGQGSVIPSRADQNNPTAFDNSGWTVNIGGGSATAEASKSAGLGLPSWAIPAIAIFGILAWWKKK